MRETNLFLEKLVENFVVFTGETAVDLVVTAHDRGRARPAESSKR
jgi:hypothetical protein